MIEDSYSSDEVDAVWHKGQVVPYFDPNVYRKDAAGAWIKRTEYGNRSSETGFGWEIDHIKPESKGGLSEIDNYQPLQWANNVAKGDDYPKWKPVVTSDGNHNVKL